MDRNSEHPVFEIPDAKLLDCLLNLDHPKGGPKARYFLAFGFDSRQPVIFAQALAAVHNSPDSRTRELDVGGRRRLVVEGPLDAPDGRRPRIRIVWQGEDHGRRLITAYPL